MPSSRGSSQPRDQVQDSHVAGNSLPSEPPGKPRPGTTKGQYSKWNTRMNLSYSGHLCHQESLSDSPFGMSIRYTYGDLFLGDLFLRAKIISVHPLMNRCWMCVNAHICIYTYIYAIKNGRKYINNAYLLEMELYVIHIIFFNIMWFSPWNFYSEYKLFLNKN